MEVLMVKDSLVRRTPSDVRCEGERSKRVAVEREVAGDEVLALWLLRLDEVLACSMSVSILSEPGVY